MSIVLIADDHNLFREGLVEFLNNLPEITDLYQANNGQEVIELLKKQSIDVVLLDINMPVMDGIATAKSMKKKWPKVKIIMLTMHDTQDYIRQVLDLGVDGYLLKTTSLSELQTAIKTVCEGEKYYGKAVQQSFINSFSKQNMVQEVKLTKREKEILTLICEELNTNEIAERLFISNYTVESHRKNLLAKTGAKNVAGLVKFALQNKII